MIVTVIDQVDHQVSMTAGLRKAFEYLKGLVPATLTEGRTEIDGENVFALVQKYRTSSPEIVKFEHHKKYIDVQYIVSGEEIIGWAPADQMEITGKYDESKDICFGTMPGEKMTPVYLASGQLAVLYPEDGHAPKLAAGAPSEVLKIVIKVALQTEVS